MKIFEHKEQPVIFTRKPLMVGATVVARIVEEKMTSRLDESLRKKYNDIKSLEKEIVDKKQDILSTLTGVPQHQQEEILADQLVGSYQTLNSMVKSFNKTKSVAKVNKEEVESEEVKVKIIKVTKQVMDVDKPGDRRKKKLSGRRHKQKKKYRYINYVKFLD